jgi:hypothetical protein
VSSILKSSLIPVLLAAVFANVGCGGGEENQEEVKIDDPSPGLHIFHIGADAQPYAGPAPLKIKFLAKPFNANGEVRYRWNFDDGTTSTEQNPTHVFEEPSRYQVIVNAKDETETSTWNLVVGTWPPKVWKRGVSGLNRAQILRITRAQDRRTSERKRRLRQRLRELRDRKREPEGAGQSAPN